MWCSKSSKKACRGMPRAALLPTQLPDSSGIAPAVRRHRARELVVPVRLGFSALLLERSTEGVVGVVVGRREIEHRSELRLGLSPAPEAEVRYPERLADRRLLGFKALGPLQRDRRLRRHSVAEPCP